MAHTAGGAEHFGVPKAKIAAVWEYQTSSLYSDAERIALDVAALRKFWREEQIVEIVAVISVFGFPNRWNDAMGTPLEEEPLAAGEKYLASHAWSPGKHRG
jgi:alkylhydroperoxidase family enzyme